MRKISNFASLPRQLGNLCALLVAVTFSVSALAQQHGVGVGKGCPTATKVGDLAMCTLTVTNEDDFGDDLIVHEFWDVIDPAGAAIRNPLAGNLPITIVQGATCTPAPISNDAPLGLVFPCVIDGVTQEGGSGNSVVVMSEYTVPVGSTDPLIDQGNVIVQDDCNIQPIGCSPELQRQQFGAAVSLFVPSIDVTKTGTAVAKAGDEITFTIGFTDTTTGIGFPGFVNCTGNDPLLGGDLGAFVEDVPRDFTYTVQGDDPDPLPNTVTITCGVDGFDNIVANSDSHSVDLIDPSIDVTKTGPVIAKVGDEITYTIGFTNTGSGLLGICTGDDPLLGGPLGVFVDGVTRDFTYTVQVGDPNPLLNMATITCDVEGFDNKASDNARHSVDLIDPSIDVTKTGPVIAKVGDEITYTIGFTNTGSGLLGICTGDDPLLGGPLGVFVDGVTRDFTYTVQVGDPNPLLNEATITCDVEGFDNKASDFARHSVDLIDPSIDVTKTGPVIAKVGDEITYTIGFTNTGSGLLGICTGDDPLLGGPLGVFVDGVTRDFTYTVQVGDPNPLLNEATITCDVEGFDNKASDFARHSVDLIDPSIDVTKTGPVIAKVGDEITYTIGFTNTGSGLLGICTGDDPLLGGPLGVFVDGVTRDFTYTVQVGDPNPLLNEATITCDVEGFDNKASDFARHSVDLIDPSIDVTKTGPVIAKVGDEITYTIGFTNTGSGLLGTCTGDDPLLGGPLGVFVDGVTRDFTYTVQVGDPNPLLNEATITCDVEGFDNKASDFARHSVDLIDPSIDVTKTGPVIAKVGDEITYTIGFTNTGSGLLGICTGDDPLLGGPLGVFVDGVTRDFTYTVQVGDPNPLLNEATITCDVEGFDNKASDFARHSVDLIDPSIDVTKTGPVIAKVGDEITYTIGFTNTGSGLLGTCTGDDPLLGGPLGVFVDGVTRDFTYTVQVGDPNPLLNEATITCDVEGFDNKASDFARHSVDLIDPSIDVTKTGPVIAKVGDEITYTIGFTNTGSGLLGICTGDDPLLGGPLGVFVDGVTRDFTYTVQVGDPNPLLNEATITCDVEGFDNKASDFASHSVDLIDPSVNLTKECRPDPLMLGDTIEWAITVNNDGDTDLNCLVNDPTAGIVDEPVTVVSGDSETLNASRTVEASDAPVISNTATVDCSIEGFDNEVNDEATADCEVVVAEICRTPGFWGTHAGVEKRKSTNLTQLVIDAAGGTLVICGEEVTNTFVPDNESAIEAMCVSPQGAQQLQLARQLTAAALNCVISGGGADCTGISVEADWADANAACIANAGDLSTWIEIIDAWNNDEVCHERELSDSDVFDGVTKLPGPAGSPKACNKATSNNVTIFSPDP